MCTIRLQLNMASSGLILICSGVLPKIHSIVLKSS
uniref:Uncharacterized protein n=1 Tax=Anguilla anguilla TaxID=7936 RepID=A0A0E9PXF8_ANGAN